MRHGSETFAVSADPVCDVASSIGGRTQFWIGAGYRTSRSSRLHAAVPAEDLS